MKVIKNMRKVLFISCSYIINYFNLKKNGVKYISFPHTRGIIHISAPKRSILMGSNIVINSGKKANPVGIGFQTSLIVINEGKIVIGGNVGLFNVSIVSRIGVEIDDDVMIGNGVCIWDTDFHDLTYEGRIKKKDRNIVSIPVEIKKGAFIGAGSIILKGVTIGEKSIVGAGSVVTKSIPPNQIWAGNPARFIKCIREDS